MSRIPQYRIGVKVSGGVEPQVELLLPGALALGVHISVDDVRITTQVTQKLKVYLIPRRTL